MAVGLLSGNGFEVTDLAAIAVTDAAGDALPVTVDRSSAFLEFDAYVAARIAFPVPADAAETGATFRIRWGPTAGAEATVVDRFAVPADGARAFGFRPAAADGPDPAASAAELVVIADREAEYYSLWYLLPMALIFVLLTIRKMRSRDGNAAASS